MKYFLDPSQYYLGDLIVFLFNPRFKHDIFRLFIIFKSNFFHDKIVDDIKNGVA